MLPAACFPPRKITKKMKHKFSLLLMLVAVVTLAGCKKLGKALTPMSSGRPYEVLVVIDNDMWERPAGRALFQILDMDVPGLPQSERSFHISQCEADDMSNALRMFRNIIMVDVNSSIYTKCSMHYITDQNAKEQYIITFQAPDEQTLCDYLIVNKQMVWNFLTRTEMNRLIAELKEKHSATAAKLAGDIFGCELWAPIELATSKKGEDFFWVSNNTSQGITNLCMYSYPYEGPDSFTPQYCYAKRDSVMQVNIPGAKPGMHVATDTLRTTCSVIGVQKQFAYEMRGLWYMKNATSIEEVMGGPFVSHSRVDTINNKVVVVEGFVFAPEKLKRGLIRRLEGSLYTMKLPEKKDK